MRILILIVIAIIAYLLFKKFTAKSHSEAPALDDPGTPSGNPDSDPDQASINSQQNSESGDNSGSGAGRSGATVAAGVAGVGAAVAAAMPNSGNQISDIQEMFKILNLRSSDAPRLSITREQYDSIKSGQATDLSGDVLDNIMGRLKAML